MDSRPLLTWHPLHLAPWGKIDPKTGEHLPLVQHLEDTARVMAELWENQPPLTHSLFIEHFGSETSARSFLQFIAAIHDVGKASSFALKALDVTNEAGERRVAHVVRYLDNVGVHFSREAQTTVRHGVIGELTLADWLQERGWKSKPARHMACLVGGHHGTNPRSTELTDSRNVRHTWDHPLLAQVRTDILDTMSAWSGADEFLDQWSSGIPVHLQMVAEALLIQADWIASNADYFPLTDRSTGQDRAARGWKLIDLPLPWTPAHHDMDSEELFTARFPTISGHPNSMQKTVVDACRSMSGSGLIILEAPMGSGKTEAAFMAAEILAQRLGCSGVFIGLPTMATANPMFSRARAWLGSVPTTAPSSISLAHGKAALNPEYRGLMEEATFSTVGDDLSTHEESQALVHQWFSGRKRTILANHVIGTIDQALFGSLKAKHVVLRHLGLHNKVVVIDEVHAADRYMRTYLTRMLEWLGRYGTPVVLMSATLPPAQRHELAAAYQKGRGLPAWNEPDADASYPRITSVTDRGVEVLTAEPTDHRTVTVQLLPTDTDLTEAVDAALTNGGCIGIIRNTVRATQETWQLLREHDPELEVVLLHSRFVAPHRMQREADLVRLLGRRGERPDRLVVIGTQVLEQSLDIDFDLLITDLSPIDLLLQRIGRLHRHDRERPNGLEQARCLVLDVPLDDEGVPKVPAWLHRMYDEATLMRTRHTLFPQVPTRVLSLPNDIPVLVAEAYRNEFTVPEHWQERFSRACNTARREGAETDRRAQSFLLASPLLKSHLQGLIAGPADDPEDARGHRQVRDGEDSLEVILLMRDAAGRIRLLEGVGAHSGSIVPHVLTDSPADQELARAIAGCTVPLPVLPPPELDQLIDELEADLDVSGWQQSRWLKGQLCLALHANEPRADLVRPITYREDIGLIVERPRKEATDDA